MASQVPLFFYAPSWDYPPPPAGPIRLGNVITSLEKPEQPLYTATLPTESDVLSSEKRNVQFSREKSRQGSFAILTQFLSVLGFGVDVGADVENSAVESFTFESITTTQFIPTPSYLQEQCINASPMVQRWLEMSRYRKPLYVITGLKVVKGANTGELQTTHVRGAHVGATVDGTMWSGGVVPISGRPEVGATKSKTTGIKWEDGSDFVLAFRVRRLKVLKNTNAILKQEDYKKGAMLGHAPGERNGGNMGLLSENEDLVIHGQDMGWETKEVIEGDEPITVAVPKVGTDVQE